MGKTFSLAATKIDKNFINSLKPDYKNYHLLFKSTLLSEIDFTSKKSDVKVNILLLGSILIRRNE